MTFPVCPVVSGTNSLVLECGVEYNSSLYPLGSGYRMKTITLSEGELHFGAQLPWWWKKKQVTRFHVNCKGQPQRGGHLTSLGWQSSAEWTRLHHRGTLTALRSTGSAGISGSLCPPVQHTSPREDGVRSGRGQHKWAEALYELRPCFFKVYFNLFILMVLEIEPPSLFYKWLSPLVCFSNRIHVK